MMVDYSKLSDFEINKAVALTVNPVLAEKECYDISGRAVFHDKRGTCGFSFISDPADAWPIIVDNKISLTCHQSRGEWSAVFNADKICMHVNPLRAAMIVFLMMREEK